MEVGSNPPEPVPLTGVMPRPMEEGDSPGTPMRLTLLLVPVRQLRAAGMRSGREPS